MCEWVASDLLKDWRQRSSAELQRLGSIDLRATEDGSKAVLELWNATFLASITAWSTGTLELITLDTSGPPPYPDPDVLTEERQLRSGARDLLDRWLERLHARRLRPRPWPRENNLHDLYSLVPLKKILRVGERVIVSKHGGWENDCAGVVVAGPEPVQTMQGEDYYYWVQFDVPPRDLDEDGPYSKAQVLSRYILLEG